jgi:hypothetical protein
MKLTNFTNKCTQYDCRVLKTPKYWGAEAPPSGSTKYRGVQTPIISTLEVQCQVLRFSITHYRLPEDAALAPKRVGAFKARSQNFEKRLLASLCLSFRPSAKNSAPTRRIFVRFDIWVLSEKLSRKWKFHKNLTKNNRYFISIPMYIYKNISLNYSYNWKYFEQKL